MGFCLNLKKISVCSVIGGRGSCWGIRFMNCVFGEWGEGGVVGELGWWIVCSVIGGRGGVVGELGLWIVCSIIGGGGVVGELGWWIVCSVIGVGGELLGN